MAMSAEDRSKFAAPFTGNGDVTIWVKNSGVERKTPNKQTVLPKHYLIKQSACQWYIQEIINLLLKRKYEYSTRSALHFQSYDNYILKNNPVNKGNYGPNIRAISLSVYVFGDIKKTTRTLANNIMQFSKLNVCKNIERTYLLPCIHMKEYRTAS